MAEFGIKYHAVIYYDFRDGERIIFVQSTMTDPKDVVWTCNECCPVAGSYYCICDYKHCARPLPMKDSIFNDIAVAYMIGVTAKELGYSIDDVPQCYTQVKLCIEGLPSIICANEYGIVFTDLHTKEPLFNRSSRLWEGREKKSLYRVLEKMLSRIKDVYNADYDISNFI